VKNECLQVARVQGKKIEAVINLSPPLLPFGVGALVLAVVQAKMAKNGDQQMRDRNRF
jgi:hypothetical protein